MGEFYQVFGTALLVAVLAGILVIFANTFYSATIGVGGYPMHMLNEGASFSRKPM